MPKSPSRREDTDESRIMETITRKPELQESLNAAFAGGRKKAQAAYENAAVELNCEG